MTRWPSITIITLSVILMQIHSIAFWVDMTGWVGAAWSLAIEAVALWFWWQSRVVMAVVASALLIFGPLYQLSDPLIQSMQGGASHEHRIELKRGEVAQLELSIAQYQENSGKRGGWSGRIDRTQNQLNTARVALDEMLLAPESKEMAWRNIAVIIMQAVVLVVVMMAQILAVISLRFRDSETIPKRGNGVRARVSGDLDGSLKGVTGNNDDIVSVVESINKKLDSVLSESGIRQGDWADSMGIARKTLSQVRNYLNHLNDGKETVSEGAVLAVAGKLGVSCDEQI